MVPVAPHADGVQPVPHGEAPTAIPAPTEVKAALGKGRGRAPEAQRPLVSGMLGPLPSSGTLALATLSLFLGSAVGKGSDGLDPRFARRGLRQAQAEQGPGPRRGLTQGSGQSCPRARTKSGQCCEGWGGGQSPADGGRGPETLRVADQHIKDTDNLGKARPLGPVLVPTVKHELVQGAGAAHGRRQAVPLLHRADDLGRGSTVLGWRLSCRPRAHNTST